MHSQKNEKMRMEQQEKGDNEETRMKQQEKRYGQSDTMGGIPVVPVNLDDFAAADAAADAAATLAALRPAPAAAKKRGPGSYNKQHPSCPQCNGSDTTVLGKRSKGYELKNWPGFAVGCTYAYMCTSGCRSQWQQTPFNFRELWFNSSRHVDQTIQVMPMTWDNKLFKMVEDPKAKLKMEKEEAKRQREENAPAKRKRAKRAKQQRDSGDALLDDLVVDMDTIETIVKHPGPLTRDWH